MKSIRSRLADSWELPLMLLVAATIRAWAAQDSLWLDELHTAWCVQDAWNDVPSRAALGNTHWLYFRALWLITQASGVNEWTLRAPSLVAGLLTIAAIYGLLRELTLDRWTASGIALAAALDSNFIFFAVEARAYAIVQLVALVHVHCLLVRFRRGIGIPARVVFVLLGALLVYLHYTAILVLAAEAFAVLALLLMRRTSPHSALAYFVDLLLIALLCSGLLYHALQVLEHSSQWFAVIDPAALPWTSLLNVLHGGWYVIPVVLVSGAMKLVSRQMQMKKNAVPPATMVIVLCVWLIPVLIAFGLTKSALAPLMLNRYVIGASTAPLLLAGFVISFSRLPARVVLLLVVTFIAANSILPSGRPAQLRHEDWRGLARMLAESPQEPILLDSGLLESPRLSEHSDKLFYDYCRFPLLTFYAPQAVRQNVFPLRRTRPRIVDPAIVPSLARSRKAWLILRTKETSAPKLTKRVLKEPALEGFEILSSQSFGRLHAIHLIRTNEE